MGIEKITESKIKDRLKNITFRIPFDQTDNVIKRITNKVTILKRDYITDLSWEKLEENMGKLKTFEKYLNRKDPY